MMDKLWAIVSKHLATIIAAIVIVLALTMVIIGSFLVSKDIKLDDINFNTEITIHYPDDDDDDAADNETKEYEDKK